MKPQNQINRAFDKPLIAQGKNVVIRKKERYHEREVGGLYMPVDTDENKRCNTGIIESIGDEVTDGIRVGDEVVYDFYATWADTHPVVITEVRNVIGLYGKTEISNNTIIPIGDRLLLYPTTEEKLEGGLIVTRDEQDIKVEECTVAGWGRDCTGKYKLGDRVIVSNRQTMKVTVGSNDFRVTKESDVLAIVREEVQEETKTDA